LDFGKKSVFVSIHWGGRHEPRGKKGGIVASRFVWLVLGTLLAVGPAAAQTAGAESTAQVVQLRQAARQGDVGAKFQLAQLFENGGAGVRPNIQEAAAWYGSAAAAGHTEAQRRLALMHLSGNGVPQSFDEAQKLFFQAAQKNDEISQFHLGRLLLTGSAGEMSVETAIQWFERSAEAGHNGAQLELGRLYIEGIHTTKDVDRGLKWIHKAANDDHPQSQYLLATLYEDGKLLPEDPEQAQLYFKRAAEAGLSDAQVWLAGWYERQEPPQYGAAIRYYKDAAKQENANGSFGVARLNLERLVHAPNSQEGLRYLREAVALNHPEAHYYIGRMYGSGSLSGGSSRALVHFQHAAQLGFPPAMYELALAYYQGTPPLKKNPGIAAQWWRRAASNGHVESQYAFSLLYLSGNGVERNEGVSFAIANVAAAQGHTDAIQLRDRLLAVLPPDRLREAQDLSVELFEQFTDGTDAGIRARLK
jgi:TPR repeat protein